MLNEGGNTRASVLCSMRCIQNHERDQGHRCRIKDVRVSFERDLERERRTQLKQVPLGGESPPMSVAGRLASEPLIRQPEWSINPMSRSSVLMKLDSEAGQR